MDKKLAKPLVNIIEKIVSKVIKKMKIPSTRVAVVDSINSDKTINVTIPPSNTVIHNFKNKTEETLSKGDGVFLLLIDGSMSNAIVWFKKGGN